jgi:uncharacterized protein (TIGR03083 family)
MDGDSLAALRAECEQVSRVVLRLSADEFAVPTRCPAWDVKGLLAHMYRDVERTIVGLSVTAPPAADTDSVSYWRRYDPAGDGADIADRAQTRAASYGTGRELALVWDWMWRRALTEAARTDEDRIVITWGPTMTFDEFLRTRVLEITVHGADLADALGMEPWATGPGLAITAEILHGLAGGELPAALKWDELTLLEKGTGRAPLSEEDRETLGPLADSFPLLG